MSKSNPAAVTIGEPPVKPNEALVPTKGQPFEINQGGQLALRSIDDQLNFAKKLIDSGMVSETFKNPQQLLIGFQYAKALGLEPVVAVKMMYVVNGRPSLYGEGPLSLVQRSPAFHQIREWFINEKQDEICPANKNLNDKVWGAVTEVWRTGDKLPQIDYFTLEDMARAKLDVNKYGKKDVWEKWERVMLRYKARTLSLRSKFADLIAGVPIAEYDDHFSPDTPEIPPRDVTAADEINREYGEENQDTGQGSTQERQV